MSLVNKHYSSRRYQQCARCVMDTSASGIIFDENGICDYCGDFLENVNDVFDQDPDKKWSLLIKLVDEIKRSGRRKTYDCVVGISGGVDSSWTLAKIVELGLRPLAVHMDNGWNSELAQNNIAMLVKKLDVDLYTHVIDWTEYRALMQAFFDADVINVELLYDNAMLALNFQIAHKFGLRYIMAGTNHASEGIKMPPGWNWINHDKKNIFGIAKKHGCGVINSYPSIGTISYIYYRYICRIKWISTLDYMEYDKVSAMNSLERDLGYKPYPYKHYESIFTRFYQAYILPEKFKIDKRRLHLSNLIASGQLDRDTALKNLREMAYPDENSRDSDIDYFLKKMNWSRDDLDDYISRPEVSHLEYPSEKKLWDFMMKSWMKLPPRLRRMIQKV